MTDNILLTESLGEDITGLSLNRPEKRNALNIPMLNAITAAVDTAHMRGARIIVFRGVGPVFCAGLDLAEAADSTKSHDSARAVAEMLEAVSQSRAVTIAAVHGAAVAGGAGLMTACDLAIAETGTKIGYPEVRRGLVAALVMTFLRRQLRERDARELLLLGELLDAERAREIGLINRVVAHGEVLDAVLELSESILKGAPGAIANTKQMLTELWPRPIETDLGWALNHHKTVRGSREAKEGIAAYNEKRKPNWER